MQAHCGAAASFCSAQLMKVWALAVTCCSLPWLLLAAHSTGASHVTFVQCDAGAAALCWWTQRPETTELQFAIHDALGKAVGACCCVLRAACCLLPLLLLLLLQGGEKITRCAQAQMRTPWW
jgi:hypothetical protein